MKKRISVAPITVFILVFLILAFLVTIYGVLTSLVLSPKQTILAWVLIGIALLTFLRVNELLIMFVRRGQIRWARAQRHEELDRLFPSWDWREKKGGLKKIPKH